MDVSTTLKEIALLSIEDCIQLVMPFGRVSPLSRMRFP